MNEQILTAANQAIFQLQMNTNDAVRYVIHHCNVSRTEAEQALKNAMVPHKSK